MELRTEKLWLIDEISKITDERLVQALKSLLEFASQYQKPTAAKDFWNELTDAQKRQIALSISQLEDGEGIPHEAWMGRQARHRTAEVAVPQRSLATVGWAHVVGPTTAGSARRE